MKFSFYYNESEHSRKINQNTISASNFCFWQLKNTSFGNQKYNYKIGKPAHRF